MFKPKQISNSLEKRTQEALETYDRLTVEEVLTSVEYSSVEEALVMFQEFDQFNHIDVLKFLYYGYEPKD